MVMNQKCCHEFADCHTEEAPKVYIQETKKSGDQIYLFFIHNMVKSHITKDSDKIPPRLRLRQKKKQSTKKASTSSVEIIDR